MNALRVQAAARKLGVSKSQVWTWARTIPEFPKPFKLAPRITVWDESELDQWLIKKQGDSDGR